MIQQINYVCEVCGAAYLNQQDCVDCEASHEKPQNIYSYVFNKEQKYPGLITIESINGRYAQYKFLKPVVPSANTNTNTTPTPNNPTTNPTTPTTQPSGN